MKKFKFLIGIVLVLNLAVQHSNAQSSIAIKGSQQYSSFKFENSEGVAQNKSYDGIFTGSYGIDYRYIFDFDLIIRSGFSMKNNGASLLYDEMNYSWKLQYANLDLGVGYIYRGWSLVHPYVICSGYYGYLLRGTQILNNEEYNVIASEIFNRMDYGLAFTPGVELKLSDLVSVFAEYNYNMGLANIENDEGQVTKNFSTGLSLGVLFTISK